MNNDDEIYFEEDSRLLIHLGEKLVANRLIVLAA